MYGTQEERALVYLVACARKYEPKIAGVSQVTRVDDPVFYCKS
jgi:hypothetical protein